MKPIRIISAGIAAATALAACTKESLPGVQSTPASLTATFASPGSRTSIDGWDTCWDKGDVISVFVTRDSKSNNYYGHSEFTCQGGDSFKGTVDKKFTSPYNWFAVYPSGDYSATSKSVQVTVEHPRSQIQTGDSNSHLCGANTPLYGFAFGQQKDPVIRMRQAASVIDFKVRNNTTSDITVTGITLTAPTAITGKFSASIDLKSMSAETAPSWEAVSSAAFQDVALEVTGSSAIQAGSTGDFFAAIHPVSATGNYTFEVTAVSNGKLLRVRKTLNGSYTFSAGKVKTVNFTFAEPEEEENPRIDTCIENEALKDYLDRVEASPYFTADAFAAWNSSTYGSTLMTAYSGNSSSNRLDHPKPVTISWVGTATDVEIFSDSEKTVEVPNEVILGSNKAEIYNLIPGQKYWYTISNDGTPVFEGDFTPTGRRRMMRVSTTYDKTNAANCRDFGGLETVSGKHLKYGLIYRGTNMDSFKNDSGMRDVILNVMGIKLDADLRDDDQMKDVPAGATDLTGYGIDRNYQDYSWRDLTDLQDPVKVKATLTDIMDYVLSDKPVYMHCTIGSDRTGYFSVLIEALLGVRQNWTDTDYEITSFCSSIISGARLRTDGNNKSNHKYKDALDFFAGFSGTTLSDKIYDYVVTSTKSNALKMDKTTVDAFIAKMQQ